MLCIGKFNISEKNSSTTSSCHGAYLSSDYIMAWHLVKHMDNFIFNLNMQTILT